VRIRQHAGPRSRAVALAGGLTALLAVVAMAGARPLTHGSTIDAESARTPLAAIAVVLLGVGIFALAGLVWLMWPARGTRRERRPAPGPTAHWLWKLAAVVVPMALGAALVTAALLGTRHAPPRMEGILPRLGLSPAAAASARPAAGASFVLPGWVGWTLAAIAGVVIVTILLVLAIVSTRRPPEPAPGEVAAGAAMRAAIQALALPGDPRLAVIAAYAAMERVLAAHGLPRPPAEAPREYLIRALGVAAGTEADLAVLTGLFEQARFSPHPIAPSGRDRAVSALDSLRRRLSSEVAG
jgi:hypothetical protein